MASEWEEKWQKQSRARCQEFKNKEDMVRKERMCEMEREEQEFEKEIAMRKKRLQAKKDMVVELRGELAKKFVTLEGHLMLIQTVKLVA